MFNENKAIKLHMNGEIIGAIRVIRPPAPTGRRVIGYCVVFLDKQFRSDDKTLQSAYTEASFIARHLSRFSRTIYRVVMRNLPPNVAHDPLFRPKTVRQFGSTALLRGSSVLLDEATGEPLF